METLKREERTERGGEKMGSRKQKKTGWPERFNKFAEGAILGAVVGDALGVPGEFMSREELRENPITDMIGGGAHGQLPGTWSDDTSMTLCTIDSITAKGIDFDDQMSRFADWLWSASNTARDEVFDVGGATKQAIFRYVKKTPPLECGELAENACGNGSLMRIMPTALYLVGQNRPCELNDHAAEIIHNTSKCTHAHIRCQMACGVFCAIVFQMTCGGNLQNAVKSGILSALDYYREKMEFASVFSEFASLAQIGQWPEADIESTGFVLHTLQAALWCLLTTSGYSECVLKAVNLGRDTDTTAAVAGALAGLWYGEREIPKSWTEKTAKYGEIKQLVSVFRYACLK